MPGVTYDTGALVAAERNDRRMWALHAAFLAEEVVPTVPAPVLAEAWRGAARQASLARMLAMCDVEAMTETHAKQIGALVVRSGHAKVVDVAVVEGAIRRGDGIVSSDRRDIERIAEAAATKIAIATI